MTRDLVAFGRLRPTMVVLLLGNLAVGSIVARAADAELLLMVDTTRSVSDAEYGALIESIAEGFESAGFLDAIQAGTTGSLAASLVFYTHRNRQEVGVAWMEITDADSAIAFAAAVREAAEPRPLAQRPTGIGGALEMAATYFQDQSPTQAVLFVGDGIDDHAQRPGGITREESVQASRDAALASGVDVMSALTIGDPGTVDAYFEQSVVGGQVGSTEGSVTNVADFSGLQTVMTPTLTQFVAGIIPEPSCAVLVLCALPILGRRRRTGTV